MTSSLFSSTRTPIDLGIWKRGAMSIMPDPSDIYAFIHERLDEIRNLPELQSRPYIHVGIEMTRGGCDAVVAKAECIYTMSVSLPFLMKGEEMWGEFAHPMANLLKANYPFLDSSNQKNFQAFLYMSSNPKSLEKVKKYILFHEFAHILNGDCDTTSKDDHASREREIKADLGSVSGSQERTEGGIYFNLALAMAFKGSSKPATHPPDIERVRYLAVSMARESPRLTGTQIKDFASYYGPACSDWHFLLANCCELETLIITDPENSCGLLERIGTKTMGFNAHNLFSLMIKLPLLRAIELGSCSRFIDEDNLKEIQKRFPHIVIQSLPGFLKLDFGLKKISTVTIAMPTLPYLSLAEAFYTPLVTTSGAGGFPIFHQPI